MTDYINVSENYVYVGQTTRIEGVGTPNATYVLAIHRRLTRDQVATTDIMVDSTIVNTATGAAFAIEWAPSTNLLLFGTNYKYYPKLYEYGADPLTGLNGSSISVVDQENLLIDFVENGLGDLQTIPIYDELSKDSVRNGNTEFSFTYRGWREDYPTLFLFDGTVTSPSSIYYDDGKIIMPNATDGTNEIYGSYLFRFFNRGQIIGFIDRTISELNMLSPVTGYNRNSVPDYWMEVVAMGSIKRAMESLFASTMFREKQVIFGNNDTLKGFNTYYSTISTNYDTIKQKTKKMHDTHPAAISGMDVLVPPRVLSTNFMNTLFLRGKAV